MVIDLLLAWTWLKSEHLINAARHLPMRMLQEELSRFTADVCSDKTHFGNRPTRPHFKNFERKFGTSAWATGRPRLGRKLNWRLLSRNSRCRAENNHAWLSAVQAIQISVIWLSFFSHHLVLQIIVFKYLITTNGVLFFSLEYALLLIKTSGRLTQS